MVNFPVVRFTFLSRLWFTAIRETFRHPHIEHYGSVAKCYMFAVDEEKLSLLKNQRCFGFIALLLVVHTFQCGLWYLWIIDTKFVSTLIFTVTFGGGDFVFTMSCFNGTWTEWQLIMRQCCLEISDRHLLSSEEIGSPMNILGFFFFYALWVLVKRNSRPRLESRIEARRPYIYFKWPRLCHFRNPLSSLFVTYFAVPPPPLHLPSPICWFSFVTGFEYSSAFVTI